MHRLHPLLARQLTRLGISSQEPPPHEQWKLLLARVSRAYQEADQDRYLLERSQDVASQEMDELYGALADEKAQLETRVQERTARLAQSEQDLAEAQRIATLGSWSYVPQTRTLNCSEECYRLFGLDSAAGPPALSGVIELVHAEDRERVRATLREAFGRGANGDIEFRIEHDSAQVWLHALLETFTGAEGEAILLRGTFRDITRQKQAEAERDFATARLNTALFGSNLVLVDVDPGGVVYLSPRWNELLGGDARETYTTFDELMELTHEDEREEILREYVDVLTGRKADYNLEHRVRAYDGSWRWIRSRGRVVERDAHGRARRLAGINEDITVRKEAQERLRQSESRFRSLLALSSDWYWEQDAGLKFTEVAGLDRQRDRLGVTQFLGQSAFPQGGQIPVGEADLARYRSLTAARQPFKDLTQTVRDVDGEWRYISFSGEPVFDADGAFTGYRGIARDVTQSRRAEERIRRLAHFDELTGLPNRTMFMHTLQRAFSLAQRRGKQFALFFIDLDRFKNINDSLGHEAGDRLLQDVARRLRHHLRESDTVARLGGDEFVVLVEDCADPRELNAIAQNILNAVGRPFTLGGAEYHVTGSVGISTYPADGQDPAALLKNADIAMYLAKDRGKNNFQFYSPQQNAHSFERLALESALRHALERREFVLHYQPKIDIRNGRIVGVEALLRWNHPDLGMVAPNQFIPLAEETGLIVPIGRWVLRTACAQLAAWRSEGLPGMRVAVNLSARQFSDDALIADVGDALAEAALAPDGLELEITESMVMHNPERAVATLSRLRDLGSFVAIDDFGTGYSSLGYLKRFPIDNVKIDRSFIKDLPHDTDDAAITRAVIAMAQSLRIRVVAEGVETREQLDFLRAHDCDECQGYYVSRPLPAAELALLARSWGREPAQLRVVPKLLTPAA